MTLRKYCFNGRSSVQKSIRFGRSFAVNLAPLSRGKALTREQLGSGSQLGDYGESRLMKEEIANATPLGESVSLRTRGNGISQGGGISQFHGKFAPLHQGPLRADQCSAIGCRSQFLHAQSMEQVVKGNGAIILSFETRSRAN